tara:strand:+ start:225 stop:533 length:309 start_codon:yes stop_codon:yes gene_type:complete
MGNKAASHSIDDLVIVVFQRTGESFSVLNSYTGIRVYHHEGVDPRVTMGGPDLPRFSSFGKCAAFLEGGEHKPCLLDYKVAKGLFAGPYAFYCDYPDSSAEA